MKTMRNTVHLIGRLGKDPEVREFENGRKLATFSIATDDTYTNQKGEKVKDTQWHNIVIWGKQADVAGKYLKKGKEIAVEGKLVTRSYESKTGEKRYSTEVNVNDFVMFGGKE